jgi:hypothetical protein
MNSLTESSNVTAMARNIARVNSKPIDFAYACCIVVLFKVQTAKEASSPSWFVVSINTVTFSDGAFKAAWNIANNNSPSVANVQI